MSTRTYDRLYNYLGPILAFFYPHKIVGRENIPEGGAIVCANHSSNWDPILIGHAFGKENWLRFMAKAELFHIPVIGKIVSGAGAFPVRRGKNDMEAIRTTMRLLKEGEKVMIFPEGTRVSTENSVTAKTGAVRLAGKTKVPIVPVYIPRKKRLFRNNPVIIGKPYYVEAVSPDDYPRLTTGLMQTIKALGDGSE